MREWEPDGRAEVFRVRPGRAKGLRLWRLRVAAHAAEGGGP